MKLKNISWIIVCFVAQLLVVGCQNDNETLTTPNAPSISNVELGLNNSKEAYAESDLHIEALIKSAVGLRSVSVQISPQTDGAGWVIYETYQSEKVKNQTEYELHKHYDIPKDAKEGAYDVAIVAIDNDGQKTVLQDSIRIVKDPSLPSATERMASYADNKLKVMAKIKAPQKLESIKIQVKNIVRTLSQEQLQEKTEYQLNEEIDVTELKKGHYHFYITIVDKAGKQFSYEDHFNK